jgi:hypothetical protein
MIRSKAQAYADCAFAAVTFVVCASLMAVAVIGHAPLAAIPLAVLVCVGCPMVMSWRLPHAIAVIKATRELDDRRALAALRRTLARLPETKHPLGL